MGVVGLREQVCDAAVRAGMVDRYDVREWKTEGIIGGKEKGRAREDSLLTGIR